ncbi:MAG: (S)-ureidoglycine aminohydrolase [Clostridia bacterium]
MNPSERLTTRTVLTRNYAIIDPNGLCPTSVPGYEGCKVYVMASPGLGANFAHYLVTIAPGGNANLSPAPEEQLFAYVLKGEASARSHDNSWGLVAGGYVYAPPGAALEMGNIVKEELRIAIFRHPYRCGGGEYPWMVAGDLDQVEADPREPGTYLQKRLLPDDAAFDLTVNVLHFDPEDSHPFVENHHESHGLLMLEGSGKYLLGDHWHEVRAGDYIWMGPFVPQAFVCTDGDGAKYLYSKEVNRDVVLP